MIIRHLNIKNFGTINDRTLEFSPGINVLYGENENERTTIHTYIKSMFFKDISEAISDNAVFVGPLKSATEQDLIRELQKFMAGCQGTGDGAMQMKVEKLFWMREWQKRRPEETDLRWEC